MNAAFTRHLPPRRPQDRPSPLPSPASGRGRKSRQRGISLFVVMIILMLALILVLGGLTVTNLNESLVGNQSDTQRAYGSAQALIDAAQRDIRLNGRRCNAVFMGGSGNNPEFMVGPAPGAAAACTRRFPRDQAEYGEMIAGLTNTPGLGNCGSATQPNFAGVCISRGPTDPNFASTTVADITSTNAQQLNNGAHYNSNFLTALDGTDTPNYGGGATTGNNVALAAAAGGTYWVEVFQYFNACSISGCDSRIVIPDGSYPFVFRITALAQGLRVGTQSVLRTYYTPYPNNQP